MTSYEHLPDDLPIPVDDGATDHMTGAEVPPVELTASMAQPGQTKNGDVLGIAQLPGRTVLFIYPRTGAPGMSLPTGWDAIPGARGCTPQACRIRDSHAEFEALGARVLGMSSQPSAEQLEAAQRLHLPYPLLSDADLQMARAWQLPTFSVDGLTLIRRITVFVMNGVVDGVIYPVFPPDRSAEAALAWLRTRRAARPPRDALVPRRGLPHPIPPRLVR